MSADARLGERLAGLEREGLARTRRTLAGPQGATVVVDGAALANFSSNDYLGLANDARLREAAHRAIDAMGVGAGASPLVSGHTRLHDEAEQRFAAFCAMPRALLFGSGYAANLGILAALGDANAEIFSDELNHASIIDGGTFSITQNGTTTNVDLTSVTTLSQLRDAINAGAMRSGDAAPYADALWALVHGIVAMATTMPFFPAERAHAAATAGFALMLDAMQPEK